VTATTRPPGWHRHPTAKLRQDPSERLRAVLELPDDPASCTALLEAAADPSLNVARAALHRLAQLGAADEARELRRRLLSVDLGIVPAYAAVLRALGDREAAAVARRGLRDRSLPVRLAAAIAQRELADPASASALRLASTDSVAGVRRVALEALGRLGRSSESEAACVAALSDPDTEVRAAAVRALAGTAKDLDARLEPVLCDRAPRVRREVARLSGRLSDRHVGVVIRDAAADVRAEALWALVRRPRRTLVDAIAAAASDPEWHVRRAACRALGAARDERASPRLLRSLLDSHPTVRAAAARALSEIFGERLVDLLAEAVGDAGDAALRKAIVYRLADAGGKVATMRIAELGGDESLDVRAAVAHALAEISANEAVAVTVLHRLARDESADVRAAAETALHRLRESDAD
jgi:HEAT repeat protein